MASVTINEKRASRRRMQELMASVAKAATGQIPTDAAQKKELEDAVVAKAHARAAERGTNVALEESRTWAELYSGRNSESRISKYGTQAEAVMDELAVSVMKRDGSLSYEQAYSVALREHPQVYAQFIEETNEQEIAKRRKRKADDPGTTMLYGKHKQDDGSTMNMRARPQDEEDDDSLDDEDDQDDEDGRDREKRRKRIAKADLSGPRCLSCATVNDGDARYCKGCGRAL